MTNLPVKLNNSPLLVARVEIMLKEDNQLIEGLVIQFLSQNRSKESELKVERFSINDIPKLVRDNEPNLKYAPLKKIYIDNDYYSIFVGDKLLSISCENYQGWDSFKKYISNLMDFFQTIPNFIDNVDLVQITYIDFIEKAFYEKLSDVLDWRIKFKQNDLSNEEIFIKTSIKEPIVSEQYNCFVQIVSNAHRENSDIQGIAIETSTLYKIDYQFSKEYLQIFEDLHRINKECFFMCLTNDFLDKLEPLYG